MSAIVTVSRPTGTGSLRGAGEFARYTLSEARTVRHHDFPYFVNRIASSCGLDENTQSAILDVQYCEEGCEEVQEFKSKLGQTGYCVYGCVKTRNTPYGIHVAYSVSVVRFELSPIKVYMEKKTKCFGLFTICTTRWCEYRSRSLTRSQEDAIRKYAMKTAHEGLRDAFWYSVMLAIEY